MTKTTYPRLGKFLKKSRLTAGLTQQQVAEKLGLKTAQFISNWEVWQQIRWRSRRLQHLYKTS